MELAQHQAEYPAGGVPQPPWHVWLVEQVRLHPAPLLLPLELLPELDPVFPLELPPPLELLLPIPPELLLPWPEPLPELPVGALLELELPLPPELLPPPPPSSPNPADGE